MIWLYLLFFKDKKDDLRMNINDWTCWMSYNDNKKQLIYLFDDLIHKIFLSEKKWYLWGSNEQ